MSHPSLASTTRLARHSDPIHVCTDLALRASSDITPDPRDTRPRAIPADGFVVTPRSMLLPLDVDDGALVPGLDSWIVRLCGIERSGRARGFAVHPPVSARVDSTVDAIDPTDPGALETLAFLSDLPVGGERAFERSCTITVSPSNTGRTIYGNPRVNLLFRAYHDRYHIGRGIAFDPVAESMIGAAHVAHAIQCEAPPLVVLALAFDGLGQSLVFERDGCFPDDQRGFVAACMIRALTSSVPPPDPLDLGAFVSWALSMLPVARF